MSDDNQESIGFWSAKWLNFAKEKTLETVDVMKRDFSEITEVVAQEASELTTAARESIDNALTSIAKEFEENERVAWVRDVMQKVATKVQSLTGENTSVGEEEFTSVYFKKDFLDEEDSVDFNQWKEKFSLGDHVDEIREIMKNEPETRKKYLEVVPSIVSSIDFWAKFFYSMHNRVVDVQPVGDLESSSTQEDDTEKENDWIDWDA